MRLPHDLLRARIDHEVADLATDTAQPAPANPFAAVTTSFDPSPVTTQVPVEALKELVRARCTSVGAAMPDSVTSKRSGGSLGNRSSVV